MRVIETLRNNMNEEKSDIFIMKNLSLQKGFLRAAEKEDYSVFRNVSDHLPTKLTFIAQW